MIVIWGINGHLETQKNASKSNNVSSLLSCNDFTLFDWKMHWIVNFCGSSLWIRFKSFTVILISAVSLFFSQSLQSISDYWCWVPSCTPGAHSCSTGWTWSMHRSQSSCGMDWAKPLKQPNHTNSNT